MNKKKTNQNKELKQSEGHLPHQHKDVKVLLPAPEHFLSKTSTPSQEKLGRVDNHQLLTQSGSKQKQLWNKKRTNCSQWYGWNCTLLETIGRKQIPAWHYLCQNVYLRGAALSYSGSSPQNLQPPSIHHPERNETSLKSECMMKNLRTPTTYQMCFNNMPKISFLLVLTSKKDTLQCNSCCVWVTSFKIFIKQSPYMKHNADIENIGWAIV